MIGNKIVGNNNYDSHPKSLYVFDNSNNNFLHKWSILQGDKKKQYFDVKIRIFVATDIYIV